MVVEKPNIWGRNERQDLDRRDRKHKDQRPIPPQVIVDNASQVGGTISDRTIARGRLGD